MIRILPDTNILISAIFWRGKPYEVIRRGILGEYQLVISAEILDEVVNTLRNKFNLHDENIQELVDILMTYCQIVDVTSKYDVVRDKSDNKIIECAYDGQADYIVTGDPDLLILKKFGRIKIVKATAFLGSLKEG